MIRGGQCSVICGGHVFCDVGEDRVLYVVGGRR